MSGYGGAKDEVTDLVTLVISGPFGFRIVAAIVWLTVGPSYGNEKMRVFELMSFGVFEWVVG